MADKPLSLTTHLAELRRRALVCAGAILIGVVLSLVFYEQIFDVLKRPGDDPQLYSYTLTGNIGPIMKVAMLGGFIVALPVTVYQIVAFISPALTRQERRYIFMVLPGVGLSFLAGVAFAYFVLVPSVVDFLLNFGTDVAVVQPSLSSYINTVVSLLFWMGVAFETPFLMYFLTVLRIGKPSFFARHRRSWVVIAFILGAVITPTFDPINQTVVAGPFIVLYEIGIWLSKLAARRPKGERRGELAGR
jgi:sec-independent protein translocase protein TatC